MRAARWSTAPRLALCALKGRAREHRVFRSDPALPATAKERRHSLFNRRGADDARRSHLYERRAFCVRKVTGRNAYLAQFIRLAFVSTCVAHRVPKPLRPPKRKARFPGISLRRG